MENPNELNNKDKIKKTEDINKPTESGQKSVQDVQIKKSSQNKMSIFDFAKSQQSNADMNKFSKKEILEKAAAFYDQFGKDLYKISKEDYLREVEENIDNLEGLSEEEKTKYMMRGQMRAITTLRKLEKAVDLKLKQMRSDKKQTNTTPDDSLKG
jgi:hypothetical protein